MKKFFALSILSLILILPGCSDNSVTDPDLNLDKPALAHKGRIDVCCPLLDPLSGCCNLVGAVMYYHEIISITHFPKGLHNIYVYLEMNTEICDMLGMMHASWTIAQTSVDTVNVNETDTAILEKFYPISNRPDILLNVKYYITTNRIGIVEASICPAGPLSLTLNDDH